MLMDPAVSRNFVFHVIILFQIQDVRDCALGTFNGHRLFVLQCPTAQKDAPGVPTFHGG